MTAALNHLKATCLENGSIAITLEMTNPAWMRGYLIFVGASMSASAAPGAYCSSFTLHPKENEDGIFAVLIEEQHKESGRKNVSFVTMHRDAYFLEVTWKDGKPYAHIDKPYFPQKGIGQMHGAGGGVPSIEVTLKNGKRVCSDEGRNTPFADANLLCKYLVGTAKAHEVLHAAVQRKLETNKDIVKFLEEEAKFLRRTARTLHAENCQHREDNTVLRNMLETAQVTLSDMVDHFRARANAWATWAEAFKPIWQSRRMQFLFAGKHQQPMPDTKALVDGSAFYLTDSVRLATRKRLGLPVPGETDLTKAA